MLAHPTPLTHALRLLGCAQTHTTTPARHARLDDGPPCGTRTRLAAACSAGGGGKTRARALTGLPAALPGLPIALPAGLPVALPAALPVALPAALPLALPIALLVALLAGALLALQPARADGHPDDIELVISIDDSDGIVAPGSEFNVTAALRFSGPHTPWRRLSIADAALRLSGPLRWQATDRSGQRPPDQFVMGGALYTPFNENDRPADDWGKVVALGLHGRTLLVGSNGMHDDDSTNAVNRGCLLYVFDTWNKRQAALIVPREHADTHDWRNSCFGRGGYWARGSAVWQESETTSWLFVSAAWDDIDGTDNVGSLYIYKLDWGQDSYKPDGRSTPLSVELVNRLVPPQSEFSNMRGTVNVNYSSAVSISADGSTLAVAAQGMNNIGAVYVYTRPDGAGESWGDIEYADGVKLTAAPAPAWGAAGARPFNPDMLAQCNAYCSRVSSLTQHGSGDFDTSSAGFGYQKIGLSDDGRVLSVGAGWKNYPFDTAGGAFSGGTQDVGEAYVFVAPQGGWQAAPTAGGTLIGAGEDASNFDPALHHSPGPARRITAPSAVLLARPWTAPTADGWFGHETAISADGSTIAASEGGIISVHIFQRDSADDWSGVLLPSATISGPAEVSSEWSYGEQGGIEFFYRDASVLLVSNVTYDGGAEDAGAVDVFTRPASGVWADADASTAERLLDANPGRNAGFGRTIVKDLDYQRLAISRPISHSPHSFGDSYSGGDTGVYLSDGGCGVVRIFTPFDRILSCRIDDNGNWVGHTHRRARYDSVDTTPIGGASAEGCAVRIVDGLSTTTCPIALGDDMRQAAVPEGARAGTHTISGQVTLSVSNAPDSAIVLSDSIEVTIGEPPQLTELRLGFATDTRFTTNTADDAPFPSLLAAGETTRLRLQLLDERGAPWDGDDTSALRITTTAGALSTRFGGGCAGGMLAEGRSCSLDAADLISDDAGAILVDLRHSGREAAVAEVRATVFSAASGETLSAAPLTVRLTGPPAALRIAAPAGGLLNIGTPDSGVDRDDRDTLTLAVSAADAAGNTVAMPPGAPFALLLGPDGARITEGVALEWPLRDAAGEPALSADGRRQARVNVDRAPEQPLANGEYTLEVRAGALKATQTLTVSGGPAAISISEPEGSLMVDQRFRLTATVVDAAGAPVPDGTRVEWLSQGIGAIPGPVRLAADTVTANGASSAEFLPIFAGAVYITAEAGNLKQVRLLQIAEPTPPRTLLDDLSSSTPNSYAVWQGEAVAASALYEALPPSVATLSQPSAAGWRHYDGSAGDFSIEPGAVLWLAGR